MKVILYSMNIYFVINNSEHTLYFYGLTIIPFYFFHYIKKQWYWLQVWTYDYKKWSKNVRKKHLLV